MKKLTEEEILDADIYISIQEQLGNTDLELIDKYITGRENAIRLSLSSSVSIQDIYEYNQKYYWGFTIDLDINEKYSLLRDLIYYSEHWRLSCQKRKLDCEFKLDEVLLQKTENNKIEEYKNEIRENEKEDRRIELERKFYLTEYSRIEFEMKSISYNLKNNSPDLPILTPESENVKVMLLNELGIFEYIKNKYADSKLNPTKLAQIVESFTGIKQDTIRQNYRAIIGERSEGNPYEQSKNITNLNNILSEMGLPRKDKKG